eukprot:5839426-Pyramimonas_sp.AAC.1
METSSARECTFSLLEERREGALSGTTSSATVIMTIRAQWIAATAALTSERTKEQLYIGSLMLNASSTMASFVGLRRQPLCSPSTSVDTLKVVEKLINKQ